MAEVIGVVSAGVGIAAFALQIADHIERLRSAGRFNRDKARDELDLLIKRLEVLRHCLLLLGNFQRTRGLELAVTNCQRVYSGVDIILQRVMKKLSHFHDTKWKIPRRTESIKGDLREARERVDSAIGDLSLACLCFISIVLIPGEPKQETDVLASIAGIDNRPPTNNGTQQSRAPMPAAIVDSCPVPTTQSSPPTRPSPRRGISDCTRWRCHCSCHTTRRFSGRFWALEYTPLSTLSGGCSNPQCTATRVLWDLQFALSRYGVPFKLGPVFEFISGNGKYSLKPALNIDKVVNYTSPGFETLWRFTQGLITLSDTRERFRELAACDTLLTRHINPAGYNYVQQLINYGPRDQDDQFELLRFFVWELGMSLGGLDQKLLVLCARWIGEGRHLSLLEAILELGFDPGCTHSPVYEEWPSLSDPGWICEERTPDPFFIEYLAVLVNACPGFAGLTALHDAVLQNDTTTVISLLSRSLPIPQENFLGQTPLHLAIGNEDIVRLLVEAGHDVNATDKQGITPLMYAAATGSCRTVQLLLTKGADPGLRERQWNRDFIAYAAVRGQWDLILDSLITIKDLYPEEPEVFEYSVTSALIRFISRRAHLYNLRSSIFAKLVSLMSDINFIFHDHRHETQDNTLLHYISSLEEAEILARHGFELFNSPNSEGQTAIFWLAPILDAPLTRFLIDQKADINHVDQQGSTVLLHLLTRLRTLSFNAWDALDSITMCLSEGVDIFSSDGSRCPCSPDGCLLPSAFDFSLENCPFSRTPGFVWGLELLSMIEELRGPDDAKRVLLGFLRRVYFERIGMTHVCSHRGRGIRCSGLSDFPTESISEDEIDEILDEEREFIAELELEMIPLTSKSFECLRSEWMVILRDNYDEQVRGSKMVDKRPKMRHASREEQYGVDYKNDRFYSHVVVSNMCQTPQWLSNYIAEYIVWLEHQYNRSRDPGGAKCQKQAWYEKRLTWFRELMEVMDLDTKAVAEEVRSIIGRGSFKENPDTEHIIDHWLASVEVLNSTKVMGGTNAT